MAYERLNLKDGDVLAANHIEHIENGIGGGNMAYERLNLKDGDILTAAHIKHMEDGIAESGGGGSAPEQVNVKITTSGANDEIVWAFYVSNGQLTHSGDIAIDTERTLTVDKGTDIFIFDSNIYTNYYAEKGVYADSATLTAEATPAENATQVYAGSDGMPAQYTIHGACEIAIWAF